MESGSAVSEPRELRIAPVMTGGASLSVWMGGACVELYRMAHADPGATAGGVYGRLLDLTGTKPVVDVITGTSAGGLNGTLLAAALAWRVPTAAFQGLRDTWMEAANLATLMRPLRESDPPSILDADGAFVPPLLKRLREWRAAPRSDTSPAAVDLVTTFTTIVPRGRVLSDDFGERMDEVTHAGTLRFTAAQLADDTDTALPEKLAIASRVSASIPGVFESAFLPLSAAEATAAGKPNFAAHATVGTAASAGWVVDGGLVVNLPLTEALDRIFAQDSPGAVRRVVLYVSPTPGMVSDGAIDPKTRPDLAQTLASVVTAPRAEGVAADLETIRRHNAAVDRQRSARMLMPTVIQAEWTSRILPDYVRARSEQSVTRTLGRLEAADVIPAEVDRGALRAHLVQARSALIPCDRLTDWADWPWGIAPLEQSISFAISIINRALATPIPPLARERADARPHDADREWIEQAYAALAEQKRQVHRIKRAADELRRIDAQFWAAQVASLSDDAKVGPGRAAAGRADPGARTGHEVDAHESKRPSSRDRIARLQAWAEASYERWPATPGQDLTITGEEGTLDRRDVLRYIEHQMWGVAAVLQEIGRPLQVIVETIVTRSAPEPHVNRCEVRQDWAARAAREAAELRDEYAAVVGGPGDSTHAVVEGLLRMHVFQTVAVGDVVDREQAVEVMQLSWNAPDYVTGRTAADKLTGNEGARMGAFMKPSWRANDFFWGQMDAAARLVRLLLDPRRLAQLGVSAQDAIARLDLGADATSDESPLLAAELAFLDDPSLPLPASLPVTVQVLARRRQREIAEAEMLPLARAIRESHDLGGEVPPQSMEFLDLVQPLNGSVPAQSASIEDKLRAMRVGEETLATERYSALLTRTLTRAVANTSAVLSGSSHGIPVVSKGISGLRAPTQAVASVVDLLGGRTSLQRQSGILIGAIAAAIVAFRLFGGSVPAPVVLAAGAVLGALLIWSMARFGVRALVTPALLLALACLAVVGGEDLKKVVYDDDGVRLTQVVDADSLTFAGDATARLSVVDAAGQKRTYEVPLSSVEVTDAGGGVTLSSTVTGRKAPWKQTWFLGPAPGEGGAPWQPWLRTLLMLAAVGLFGAAALAHRGRRRRVVAGLIAAALGLVVPWVSPWLLTGSSTPVKDWLIWLSQGLHSMNPWFSVAVIVVVGGIAGRIGDRMATAALRLRRRGRQRA